MEKRIKNFADFTGLNLSEGDGFGTMPFLFRRDGDLYYYFFQLELENGSTKGYMFVIGKYSQFETVEGPKNSYAVLNVNEISPELIEDIAINKTDPPDVNEEKFSLEGNDLSRFFELVCKALLSYLEKNPKVVRIFDEMSTNCEIEDYEEVMRSMFLSFLGSEWSIQEGSQKGIFIINR